MRRRELLADLLPLVIGVYADAYGHARKSPGVNSANQPSSQSETYPIKCWKAGIRKCRTRKVGKFLGIINAAHIILRVADERDATARLILLLPKVIFFRAAGVLPFLL